nr:hypothetical protein [Candidatus Enterousia merdequi]
RTNCLTDVADCFKDACGAKFDPEQDGNDFDLCLSDPSMVAGLCKVKLDPCLKAFNTSDTAETIMRNKGATDNILWKGVKARLKVMQVNACTKELKECLTAEEACGSDYSGCLGLTTDDIVKLCPEEKLLACQDEYNLETVRKNLMEFAQTIALNIDNNMLEICQNSVKKAMESTCGDEKMCPNISFAEGNIKDLMSMRICKDKNLSSDATGGTTVGDNLICYPDVYAVNKTDDIIKGFVQATLVGKPDMSFIDVDYSKETVLQRAMVVNGKRKMSKPETEIQYFSVPDDKQNIEEIKTVVRMLEQAVDTKMNQLSKDPKVEFCVTGRQIQGISEDADNSTKVSANQTGRYPNLLDSVREEISSEALANLMSVVETVSAEVIEQDYEKVNNTINDRLTTLIAMDQQKQHQYNEAACKKKEERHGAPNIHGCRREYSDTIATYDSSTSVCSIVTTTYRRNGCGMSYKFYEQSKSTITASMPVVTRETMVKGGASETAVEAEQTTLGNYN